MVVESWGWGPCLQSWPSSGYHGCTRWSWGDMPPRYISASVWTFQIYVRGYMLEEYCCHASFEWPELWLTLEVTSLVFCHTGSFLDLRQLLLSRSASSTMAVPLTRLSTQHQSSCTSDRISCRQDRISKQRKIKDRILIMASLLLSPSTLVRGRSPPRDTIGSENLLRKIRSAVDLPGLRFSLHPSFPLPNCQLSGKSK